MFLQLFHYLSYRYHWQFRINYFQEQKWNVKYFQLLYSYVLKYELIIEQKLEGLKVFGTKNTHIRDFTNALLSGADKL